MTRDYHSSNVAAWNFAYNLGYRAGNYSDGPSEKSDNPFSIGQDRIAWFAGFDNGRYGAGDRLAS